MMLIIKHIWWICSESGKIVFDKDFSEKFRILVFSRTRTTINANSTWNLNYFSQLSVRQTGKKEFVGDLLAKNIQLQILPTKLYTDG